MDRYGISRLITNCILFLLLVSCTAPNRDIKLRRLTVPTQRLAFSEDNYETLLWIPEKGLTAFSVDFYKPAEDQVSYTLPGDGQKHQILLPSDPECSFYTRYSVMNILPDGRIGLIKSCGKALSDPQKDSSHLLAYSWDLKRLEPLVAGASPKMSNRFTWNPAMSRGVQELSTGLNGTLYWITPSGFEPMRLTLSFGRMSWDLSEAFPNFLEPANYGIVKAPAWSPVSEVIAFWASFDPIGKTGISRLHGESKLVFLNPMTMAYDYVLTDFYDAGTITWSPNGEWLAFNGRLGILGDHELWVFSQSKKQLVSVASGSINGSPVWSPESQFLYVRSCSEALCEKQAIDQFDVSEIVK